jgi:hypothetical protein
MKAPDRRVRHHEAAAADALRVEDRAGAFAHALADPDRRGLRPDRHVDANRFFLDLGAQGVACVV